MKYAIIADIHANLEAFQTVLEDIKAQNCTHTACLGDVGMPLTLCWPSSFLWISPALARGLEPGGWIWLTRSLCAAAVPVPATPSRA